MSMIESARDRIDELEKENEALVDLIKALIEKWKDDKEHGHNSIPINLAIDDLKELLKEQTNDKTKEERQV